MTDRVGQQLGNYRLTRLLGEGGFAHVYLGEHVYLGKQAAIKVLHRQETEDALESFLREAQTIASLEHPNIVRVLDFGVEGKVPFLVMSYAPNGTLRQRHCAGSRLSLTSITAYLGQVAAALQYAHTQKLIHRDVKPQNMLIGLNDEVLLSDFGLAIMSQSTSFQSTQDKAVPWPTWLLNSSRANPALPVISTPWGSSSTNGCAENAPFMETILS